MSQRNRDDLVRRGLEALDKGLIRYGKVLGSQVMRVPEGYVGPTIEGTARNVHRIEISPSHPNDSTRSKTAELVKDLERNPECMHRVGEVAKQLSVSDPTRKTKRSRNLGFSAGDE